MLLVEGMMHRMEMAYALHQLQSGAQRHVVLGKLPGILALIASRNAAPLIATIAPLVLGKGTLSRLVRRVLLMLGAGAGVALLFRRWRERT